ncbi:ankyrin repeat domain 40 [Cricetulus griseus]
MESMSVCPRGAQGAIFQRGEQDEQELRSCSDSIFLVAVVRALFAGLHFSLSVPTPIRSWGQQKEQQERLREAAALGDIREVQKLVESGVDVNSQNEVNGWTCLHWACKRNHGQVVSYLLKSGADREILTTKGEMPVQLTSRREIRKIMGVEEADDDDELPQLKKESELPFVPNYLANPAFPFIYSPAAEDSTQLQNGGSSTPPASPPTDGSPPLLPPTEPPLLGAFPRDHTSLALVQNGDISAPSAILRTPESTKPGPVCQPPVSQNRSLFSSVPPKPPVSLEPQNGTYAGPAPAFQPFFFTGAFPFNMQELVLKVRIQNPSLRENDFIEIELDRQELTYQELLRVSCCELGVNPDQVEKIRKLPNTLLRKDKDVARLQDFQELELVLMITPVTASMSSEAAPKTGEETASHLQILS